MPAPAVRTALAVAAALALAAAGCGGDDEDPPARTAAGAPAQGATQAPPAQDGATGYPQAATKNTTRVATPAGAPTGAAVARIVFPGGSERPDAIALADVRDWRGALAGAVLMAPPLRAPMLLTDGGEVPPATAAATEALRPRGSSRLGGAQAVRLGAAGDPPGGLRVTSVPGDDPYTLAANIDDLRSRVAGRRSERVLVVSAEDPAYAMPAAAWAAKSGDPVLFTARTSLPAPTRRAIRAHGRPRIYVLGPSAAVAPGVEAQLARLGTVTRIAGRDAAATAIAFARFRDGAFGWGITDPGHGLVFANPSRPPDAGTAAPLSASGTYGPLLLVGRDGALPRSVREYLLDIKPGFSSDPVRGVYNHGWLVGDPSAVSVEAQTQIDGLLEITRVPATRETQ
jgi:hypothetical protein